MALITRRPKPNPKRERFLDLCAMGKSSKSAGEEVGYTENTSREYHSRYAAEIHQRAIERLKRHVPGAVATIIELAGDSRSHAVRLAAANRVLEAAGEGVVHKQEVTYRTDADLVQALLDSVGGDKAKAAQVLTTMGVPLPPQLQTETVH